MQLTPLGRNQQSLHARRCKKCGADVPVPETGTHAICWHCGDRIFVEPNVRRRHEELSRAQLEESEALSALDGQIVSALKQRGWKRLIIAGVLAGAPAGIARLPIEHWGKQLDPSLLVLLHAVVFVFAAIACVVVAVGWAVWLLPSRVRAGADAKYARHRQELARSDAPEGRCPTCNAPVALGGGSATVSCAHCGAPLVVALGIVIRHTADARDRIRQWRARAREAFDADDSFEVWQVFFYAVFLFIVAVGIEAFFVLVEALIDSIA